MNVNDVIKETRMQKTFAVVNDVDQTPVFVKQGQLGFWPCGLDQLNKWKRMYLSQSSELTNAAKLGSMFGWDVPAARLAQD